MPKARILIVDDSAVGRRFVSEALAGDDTIESVGTAATGQIALAKIAMLNPDLVTLDIEMPEMDGLKTLKLIRQSYPRLPVIMVSALPRRGAMAAIEALLLGADDYVSKPSAPSAVESRAILRSDLVPKIKALCERPLLARRAVPKVPQTREQTEAPPRRRNRIDVVAIGISTGGPNALAEVIPQLPRNLPVPIVICQHMPPDFTKSLAARLSAVSKIPVEEAIDGAELLPGQVWLAPGDYHLEVASVSSRVRLRTHQGSPENNSRPSVDVLFRSVAERYGANALAVIMTGMGQDGWRGCRCIRATGGEIWAQDEASSVVWGMAGGVVRSNLADRVLTLDQVGPALARRVEVDRTIGKEMGRASTEEGHACNLTP